MNNLDDLITYFDQLPILIKLVWILSLALFTLAIIFVAYLKFLRSYLRRKKLRIDKYKEKYDTLLISYLYAGNNNDILSIEQVEIISQLKTEILDVFKRKILVDTLLNLKNEISGEMADSIQRLYVDTGFVTYALINLKSRKWYVVAKGIRELTQFQVKPVHKEVQLLLNHPKKEVRKEVQLYVVSLFHFKGLEYLSDLKSPLSEWDQIQLLEILQHFEDQQILDISPWLRSNNDSVVIFSLKLAKIYNQFGLKEDLIELLSHKCERIRVQTISVLDHLYVLESKRILKTTFNERTTNERIVFFKMLENLFEIEDEPFLLQHVNDENFEIKLSALKILKQVNSVKLKSLGAESSDVEYREMVKFVENN